MPMRANTKRSILPLQNELSTPDACVSPFFRFLRVVASDESKSHGAQKFHLRSGNVFDKQRVAVIEFTFLDGPLRSRLKDQPYDSFLPAARG